MIVAMSYPVGIKYSKDCIKNAACRDYSCVPFYISIYTPVTLLILSSGTGYKTKTFRVNFKSQENIASLCLIKKVL